MLFPRSKHLINVEIGATRFKLEKTEQAISKLEEERIDLIKIIRKFSKLEEERIDLIKIIRKFIRSGHYCGCFSQKLEDIDRRILARHTYLGKYKHILCNLYIELKQGIK
jgi:cell fate regulator YaaT (PSP1 superfamily)